MGRFNIVCHPDDDFKLPIFIESQHDTNPMDFKLYSTPTSPHKSQPILLNEQVQNLYYTSSQKK